MSKNAEILVVDVTSPESTEVIPARTVDSYFLGRRINNYLLVFVHPETGDKTTIDFKNETGHTPDLQRKVDEAIARAMGSGTEGA